MLSLLIVVVLFIVLSFVVVVLSFVDVVVVVVCILLLMVMLFFYCFCCRICCYCIFLGLDPFLLTIPWIFVGFDYCCAGYVFVRCVHLFTVLFCFVCGLFAVCLRFALLLLLLLLLIPPLRF